MLKITFKILIITFICGKSYGQNFSALWKAHYSYNNITDIVTGENKIYAAAQNAVFEYDIVSETLKTITSVDGLSGEQISTIYYSQIYESLIIGYETGLLEVYSETDNNVLSVVDILDKQNIPPTSKRINHFYEDNGFIYIATNYGISVYDLERLEFGDTYFIGNGGTQIPVKQTTIFNNEIYAACFNGNGVKKADLSNPNLIDFQQWETITSASYVTINTFNNKVYAVTNSNQLTEIDGVNASTILILPALVLDSNTTNSKLIYTTSNTVYVYNETLQLNTSYTPTPDFETNFTAAIELDNNIYIGTQNFGVLSATINTTNYTEIKPNGPLENEIFRLNAETNSVWATYGQYSAVLNPYPLNSKGISYYNNETWKSIPFDSLLVTRELNTITPNIFNPNQVFVSSFFNGILEINNFEATIQLNQTNSGLESLILPNDPNYVDIRINATEFDSSGKLWILNSRVDKALKSYDPITGSWQGYSFSSLIDNPFEDETGFFDIAIGSDGTKWIGSYDNGLFGYNENNSVLKIKNIKASDQDISNFARFTALAIDNRNQLWIGTTFGLRVLYNTSGFFEDNNPILSQIIILEDGIPKELLEGQSITDIEVDGSNNKWVGTADGGVFYFSPNGQTTIYQFTKDNSPLPSNTINDISLDAVNGIVYIATNKGMLAFSSGGSKPQESLDSALVYPNPVRPEYDILGSSNLNDINKGIKITGLTERVNVKITDIEGNLVAEAQSGVNLRSSSNNYNLAIDGGTAIWNGKNLSNTIVATGVYLILLYDTDSFETNVLKVLIVR